MNDQQGDALLGTFAEHGIPDARPFFFSPNNVKYTSTIPFILLHVTLGKKGTSFVL